MNHSQEIEVNLPIDDQRESWTAPELQKLPVAETANPAISSNFDGFSFS